MAKSVTNMKLHVKDDTGNTLTVFELGELYDPLIEDIRSANAQLTDWSDIEVVLTFVKKEVISNDE